MDKFTRDFFNSILNDGGSPVYTNPLKFKAREKPETKAKPIEAKLTEEPKGSLEKIEPQVQPKESQPEEEKISQNP